MIVTFLYFILFILFFKIIKEKTSFLFDDPM